MSEFQFYEFRSIDRAFTAAEKAEINTWSSRAKASNHKVEFSYSYSDFPKDDVAVMFQYFDAMLYWANFGCKKLMFRFPLATVNKKALLPYTFSENIEILTEGEYLLLIISENTEDGGYEDWFDADNAVLSDLLAIRQEIMDGDYRALYLAWLYFHSTDNKGGFPEDYYEGEEDTEDEDFESSALAIEPPVPANLAKMSSADTALCEFLGLSTDWIVAATANSPETKDAPIDLPALISQLSETEKNDFLFRLAKQEANLASLFLQKLKQLLPEKAEKTPTTGRSVREIEEIVAEKRQKRFQAQKEASEAEALAALQYTHTNRQHIWKETARLLALRTAKGYDEATKNIEKLYASARHNQDLAAYQILFRDTVAPYKSAHSFIKRIKHLPYTERL